MSQVIRVGVSPSVSELYIMLQDWLLKSCALPAYKSQILSISHCQIYNMTMPDEMVRDTITKKKERIYVPLIRATVEQCYRSNEFYKAPSLVVCDDVEISAECR